MTRHIITAAVIVMVCSVTSTAQDARAVVAVAAMAAGTDKLTSIQYTAHGFDFLFGQSYEGGRPWPRFNVPRLTVDIDFSAPAIRDDRVRRQGLNPPLGGGNQPIEEQRQIWLASGSFAWNQNGPNANPAGEERDQRPAIEGRLAQIWLNPHGFLKAAMAAQATTTVMTIGERRKTVIAFTSPTQARFEATLNDENLIERIETWLHSPVLGDTLFEATFRDYRDFGGIKFPTRIIQREGGFSVLDVTVTDVKPNGAAPIEVPAGIRAAKPAAPFVSRPIKVADGLWSIPVNRRDKVFAVEFTDYVIAVEGPQSEEDTLHAVEAMKTLFGNKPIRYVVNTHHHFDHSGGLRTFAAEGATVLTWRGNVPYYQEVWSNPRTIRPDRLSRSGRRPMFEGIVSARTFADGQQQMVIYHYAGNLHNPGMLMVHFPKLRMLIEADSYNPPGNINNPPNAMPNLVQWYEYVERLGIEVDTLLPIHSEISPMDHARRAYESFGPLYKNYGTLP
jgi:glyoxylase-like metal-dependent hydrolase (beta-lactamase superfamily II)